jgi:hypothetical protein
MYIFKQALTDGVANRIKTDEAAHENAHKDTDVLPQVVGEHKHPND